MIDSAAVEPAEPKDAAQYVRNGLPRGPKWFRFRLVGSDKIAVDFSDDGHVWVQMAVLNDQTGLPPALMTNRETWWP